MEFMINSETLDKLRPKISEAIDLLNKSIEEKRPILLRHHADCDGYSGAIALEQAILKKMNKVHRRESDLFYYYRRNPSRAPFYDYSDVTKDIANFTSNSARFERKEPLVIVVDNGSSDQDILSLKKLRIYNVKVLVIDHHPASHDREYIDVHINPAIEGMPGDFSAGMICAEIANQLGISRMEFLAALAGIGDRSTGPDIAQYIEKAEQLGYSMDHLTKLAEVIDFEAMHFGYMENRQPVSDLFFSDKQNALIDLAYEEIMKKKQEAMCAIEHYAQIEDHEKAIIARIDTDSISHPGSYPARGKITSLLRDSLEEKHKKAVAALGIGKTFITFRFGNIDLDMNKILADVKERYPYALVDGGGHPKAGTIRFISAAHDEILDTVIEYIKSRVSS